MISLVRLISRPKERAPQFATNARSGFSLLELMLALGLLGALLAVAWSLLGTYRNAEVRGWKLSHRVQTVRSARAWLESDAQHLIIGTQSVALAANPQAPLVGSKQSADQPAKSHRFTGSAMGFTATIAPSIDPIPFLENLMLDATQLDREPLASDSLLGNEADANLASSSPWPAETIEIEYRLMPMDSASAQSNLPPSNVSIDNEIDDSQYVLTRYETIEFKSQTTAANPSERLLSAQDLYRQADESVQDSNQTYRESKLEGLTKVKFRYFDGSTWRSNWNSDQQGGLPRAIAFGFDFPAASDIRIPSTDRVEPKDTEGMLSEQLQVSELPFADSASAADSMVESSSASSLAMMESSISEVQIVVLVANGVSKSTADAITSMQRARP